MLLFSTKKAVFRAFSHQKKKKKVPIQPQLVQYAWNRFKYYESSIFIERAWRYLLWIGSNEFSKKSAIKFPTLRQGNLGEILCVHQGNLAEILQKHLTPTRKKQYAAGWDVAATSNPLKKKNPL